MRERHTETDRLRQRQTERQRTTIRVRAVVHALSGACDFGGEERPRDRREEEVR